MHVLMQSPQSNFSDMHRSGAWKIVLCGFVFEAEGGDVDRIDL